MGGPGWAFITGRTPTTLVRLGRLHARRHGAHSERSVTTLRGPINRRYLPSAVGVVLVNPELIRIFVVSFAIVALSQSGY